MSKPNFDVKAIFEKALEFTDPTTRAAYLAGACGDNAALRAEIEGLLIALERAGEFLNRGPAPKAATGAFSPAEPSSPPIPGSAVTGTASSALPSPSETESYSPRVISLGVIVAGKYKLIEEIGEGGMGTVYLAQQTEPVRRLVAVKVIKVGMDSKAVLARFEAERQALAMMDHPNIARVLDAEPRRMAGLSS